MALSGGCGRLFYCIFILSSNVNGALWLKFEISENIRLQEEIFASFSNCDSGPKCVARCHMERFCGFAQYSTHGKECKLVSIEVCGSDEPASQWNLYKRIPTDITDYLGNAGNVMLPNANSNGYNSIDGDITTFSYATIGSWWAMDFDSVWPIAKVTVSYFRPYYQKLYIDMSGTRFDGGPCTNVPGLNGVRCLYLPSTGCWHNASSINITSQDTNLGLELYEINIYS